MDFLGLDSMSSFLEANRLGYAGGLLMDEEKGQDRAEMSVLRKF